VIFRSENIDKFMALGEEAKEWAARQREKADKAMALRAEPRTPTAMPADVMGYLNQYRAKMVRA
jgi:hypothetical protein